MHEQLHYHLCIAYENVIITLDFLLPNKFSIFLRKCYILLDDMLKTTRE